MTATHDIDRLLATWFAADAVETAPAGLVEAIATATATTRRRPGWLSLDRWLPGAPAASDGRSRGRAGRAAARDGGRLAHRGGLPAPRATAVRPGPARAVRDGHRWRHRDDELRTAGRSWRLTTGEAMDINPTFSRDGTQLAFWSWPPDSNLSDARGHGRGRVGTVTRSPGRVHRATATTTRRVRMVPGRSLHRVLAVRREPVAGLRREHRRRAGRHRSATRRLKGASSLVAGRLDDRVRRRCYRPRPRACTCMRSGRHGRATDLGRRRVGRAIRPDVVARRPPPRVHDAGRLAGEGKGANLWMVDVDGSNEHQVDEAGVPGLRRLVAGRSTARLAARRADLSDRPRSTSPTRMARTSSGSQRRPAAVRPAV